MEEGVDVDHEGLGPADDELVDAGQRVRADLGRVVLEKLQELGDQNVQRPVQRVAVQNLGRVFANLLQRSERSLAHVVVLKPMEHKTSVKLGKPKAKKN